MNNGRKSRSNLRLFVDFDSTITKSDTCTLIPQLLKNPEKNQAWEMVSNDFLKKYETILSKYEGNISMSNISDFLNEMDHVELFGVNSVEQNNLLEGLSKKDLEELPKKFHTELAPQCESLFELLYEFGKKKNIELCIISSNWSFDVIQSFIKQNVQKHVNTHLNIFSVDRINETLTNPEVIPTIPTQWSVENSSFPNIYIYTNDLQFNENGISTGKFSSKQCVTSMDKLMSLRHHLFISRDTSKTIYIGDSVNDLRCILETNGILYHPRNNEETTILSLFKRLGIPLSKLPQNAASSIQQVQTTLIPSPHFASNWEEITSSIRSELLVN
ncbi:predicted protein [Naegleria gruberi]|uniref:Predicted protein n=1 Tax=Naegleria gruberi TaxID=5762 RepID=D2UYH4_NAEGR|nr:uncharacterized protein NAEGRDRAFT_61471 [Naegleria gruberi]EFC50793.1 predicted protein [Naegleria gruberi]|eukprot:XP_002683537.1 predicted protein [Naegleria gruberi strain NEG-M]